VEKIPTAHRTKEIDKTCCMPARHLYTKHEQESRSRQQRSIRSPLRKRHMMIGYIFIRSVSLTGLSALSEEHAEPMEVQDELLNQHWQGRSVDLPRRLDSSIRICQRPVKMCLHGSSKGTSAHFALIMKPSHYFLQYLLEHSLRPG
jgi:hypothetical protein